MTVKMKFLICGNCGVEHAIPEIIWETCYNEGGSWYCPNGHRRGYKTGGIQDQLEEERRARERAEQKIAQVEEEREFLRRSNIALKGAATKQRKRTAAGVCPCCTRSFQNLHRHMKTKHPGYSNET